jgi:hypothetical protein
MARALTIPRTRGFFEHPVPCVMWRRSFLYLNRPTARTYHALYCCLPLEAGWIFGVMGFPYAAGAFRPGVYNLMYPRLSIAFTHIVSTNLLFPFFAMRSHVIVLALLTAGTQARSTANYDHICPDRDGQTEQIQVGYTIRYRCGAFGSHDGNRVPTETATECAQLCADQPGASCTGSSWLSDQKRCVLSGTRPSGSRPRTVFMQRLNDYEIGDGRDPFGSDCQQQKQQCNTQLDQCTSDAASSAQELAQCRDDAVSSGQDLNLCREEAITAGRDLDTCRNEAARARDQCRNDAAIATQDLNTCRNDATRDREQCRSDAASSTQQLNNCRTEAARERDQCRNEAASSAQELLTCRNDASRQQEQCRNDATRQQEQCRHDAALSAQELSTCRNDALRQQEQCRNDAASSAQELSTCRADLARLRQELSQSQAVLCKSRPAILNISKIKTNRGLTYQLIQQGPRDHDRWVTVGGVRFKMLCNECK